MDQPSAEWPNQEEAQPEADRLADAHFAQPRTIRNKEITTDPEDDAVSSLGSRRSATKQAHPPIASALQNWQVVENVPSVNTAVERKSARHQAVYVDNGISDQQHSGVEIEGEATVVVEPLPVSPEAKQLIDTPVASPTSPIEDLLDPAIVITLHERHIVLRPGEEGEYQLTILNNGSERADFRVTVEGWIDERWVTTPPPQITLDPGERRQLTVSLSLPQQPMPLAGTYGVAIVVREFGTRSTHYGTRLSRCGATLRILPHTELHLGSMQPATLALSWWQKEQQATIPLVNHSNYPVAVRLHVRQSPSGRCAWSIHSGSKVSPGSQETPATLLLRPGERRKVAMRVHLQTHPLFGLHPTTAVVQLVATSTDMAVTNASIAADHTPASADTTGNEHGTSNNSQQRPIADDTRHVPWQASTSMAVTAKPLIGIWHVTSVLTLLVVAAMGMGLAGLTALLLFGLNARSVEPAPQPVQPMAAQPIIVAYIQAPINQTRLDQTRIDQTQAEAPVQVDIAGQVAGVPQLSQADITSPGDGATVTDVTDVDTLSPVTILPGPPGTREEGTVAETGLGTVAVEPSVLQPQQVTAPGAPLPTPIISNIPPATPAPMTYATMFREIAHRYDLNWRVLAAQAYVESGFDTVALGAHGDLGLMQVLPGTWHEWAPTVNASDPFDSYSNVLVAAAYLDYLRSTLSKQGHPEIEWTLVAYNSGIDRVLQHIDGGEGWQELDASRRNYATEILRLAETIPTE